jgi:hypothetical protein
VVVLRFRVMGGLNCKKVMKDCIAGSVNIYGLWIRRKWVKGCKD